MSYCVNCGVELAPSEKKCPLCDVPVINPVNPWVEPEQRPYPKQVEYLMSRIDRRYGAWLVSLFLSIPVTLSLILDLIISGRISWSGYVVGGGIWAFTCIIVPLYYKKPSAYICLGLDVAATLLYLLIISYMTNLSWYIPLALPLTLLTGALAWAFIFIRRTTLTHGLYKVAIFIFLCGLYVVGIECVINYFIRSALYLRWSFFVLAPLAIISLIFVLLEKRKGLKDEIIKRLFI